MYQYARNQGQSGPIDSLNDTHTVPGNGVGSTHKYIYMYLKKTIYTKLYVIYTNLTMVPQMLHRLGDIDAILHVKQGFARIFREKVSKGARLQGQCKDSFEQSRIKSCKCIMSPSHDNF